MRWSKFWSFPIGHSKNNNFLKDEDFTRLLDGTFVTDGPVDVAGYKFVEMGDLDYEAGKTERTLLV